MTSTDEPLPVRARRGVFPGSFNPPTIAHVAIALAAKHQLELDRVDLALSRHPLGKGTVVRPAFDDRVDILRRVAEAHAGLHVVVTDERLIADIAVGYDAVVMGADKWHQLHDPTFYNSEDHRRLALARLPAVAVAPRSGLELPTGVRVLDLALPLTEVSSSEARAGARSLMAPEAAAFDATTGAWSDPARYDAWRALPAARLEPEAPPPPRSGAPRGE